MKESPPAFAGIGPRRGDDQRHRNAARGEDRRLYIKASRDGVLRRGRADPLGSPVAARCARPALAPSHGRALAQDYLAGQPRDIARQIARAVVVRPGYRDDRPHGAAVLVSQGPLDMPQDRRRRL